MQKPTRKKRKYLPENLKITNWETIQPYFEKLASKTINTPEDLKEFLRDVSEIEAVFEEEEAWRYIRMSQDTTNETNKQSYETFIQNIAPNISSYYNQFEKKILASPYHKDLPQETYGVMLRNIKNKNELYTSKNDALKPEIEKLITEYTALIGKMTVTIEGEEKTMQEATTILEETDRNKREQTFKAMWNRRARETKNINNIYNKLIKLRLEQAKNAGYNNYIEYQYKKLQRFDYKEKDCEEYRRSIQKEVVPFITKLHEKRKKALKLTTLKPWDLHVDPQNEAPLRPFNNTKELLEKMLVCFKKIHPTFETMLSYLQETNRLDLETRKGKMPGGYNYPLLESGTPFIFMNAAGTQYDIETLAHEGGHAIHAILTHNLELTAFKDKTPEIGELASETMELLSMEHWEEYYQDKEELKRAKKEKLEGLLKGFIWIAMIDEFQHWIYNNPQHTNTEREDKWKEILTTYGNLGCDWEGMERLGEVHWQRQAHVFETPLFYIEYAICGLAAIAIWKNYTENPKQTIHNYTEALKLGGTKTIPEVYETAGIKFDFSQAYIRELTTFIEQELEKLED